MVFLRGVTTRTDFEFRVFDFGTLMCVYTKWKQVVDEFLMSHLMFGRNTFQIAAECGEVNSVPHGICRLMLGLKKEVPEVSSVDVPTCAESSSTTFYASITTRPRATIAS